MAGKCKAHPLEQWPGVCASCLRERLFDVLAEQSRGRIGGGVNRTDQSPSPAPVVFPRSVSPYVAARRSVDFDPRSRGNLRFFSTPQAGPGLARATASPAGGLFSSIFGRSQPSDQDRGSGKAPRRSMSWLSALIPGKKKKKKAQPAASHPPARSAEELWQRNMAGFCLSPLVQPGPRRSYKAEPSGLAGGPSDLTGGPFPGPLRRRGSIGPDPTPLPLCRSWKIADTRRFR
ncbi:uncharacterized protein LOC144708851 [Wolffia australiana]